MTNNSLAVIEVYVNADYGYEVSAEVVCQQRVCYNHACGYCLGAFCGAARTPNFQRLAGAFSRMPMLWKLSNGWNRFRRGGPSVAPMHGTVT